MLQTIPEMEPELLEKIVRTLPTDPHSMNITMWRFDYSSIEDQLKGMAPLKNGQFRLGEAANVNGPINNEASVQNPTNDMVIQIYKDSCNTKIKEAWEDPRVDISHVEWDYTQKAGHYGYFPDEKLFRAEKPVHPDYPTEVKLEDIEPGFRKSVMREKHHPDSHLISNAHQLLGENDLPSSKVKLRPTEIIVNYSGKEPDYLPALEKVMKGTGKLSIQKVG